MATLDAHPNLIPAMTPSPPLRHPARQHVMQKDNLLPCVGSRHPALSSRPWAPATLKVPVSISFPSPSPTNPAPS